MTVNQVVISVVLPLLGFQSAQMNVFNKKAPVVVIGKTDQVVDSTSALASEEINAYADVNKSGERRIFVHFILKNNSNTTLYIRDDAFTFDLRRDDGTRASETEIGCAYHFFRACHTNALENRDRLPRLQSRILAPGESYKSTVNLGIYYESISSGRYSVIGYVCGLEGGKCFRSNAAKLTVN
jgi:hypothetical protein